MKRSYLDYAMSVIIGRALPDVRDGLKPAHRRVLYAMRQMGLASNRAYRKCAKIVGEVIGNYHPHGDAPAYDTLVRLAQDFNMRTTLVDGQGNFGSVDGDPPAAYRYTEARLEAIAERLMDDLDNETVDYQPNFDETTTEPTVLPAPYPNLLVNGSTGIAVGMATNIPPHNLGEVIDGVVWYIQNTLMDVDGRPPQQLSREQKLKELIRLIPGPDFPTGGLIVGRRGIHDAYIHGRGGIQVRAKAEIETTKKGDREQIIVTEIPYQVNKAKLLERIAELRSREDHRRHFRPARRIGSHGHADRHRAEARRSGGGDSQQPLQAHLAAADVRHHHARDRGRAGRGVEPARSGRALRRVPPRGGAPAHRVRAAQGRSARAHSRRPAHRARQPRRGDQADSRLEEPARSEERIDDAVRADGDPGAGDSRHAAAAPHRPRAAEDSRRARRADGADHQAARHSGQPAAAAADHHRRAEGGEGRSSPIRAARS